MPEYKAPLRDMQFSMNEVLDFEAHYGALPDGEVASVDIVRAILEEAGRFSESVLSPLNARGDAEGCQWQDGNVLTPTGFKEAYRRYVDNGWPSLTQESTAGGQGLPTSLGMIVYEMLTSANHAWALYTVLGASAVNTLKVHGSSMQQQLFLPPMVEGRWLGTMCLTEPHCGSDLGLLRTRAVPGEGDSFRITGTKIFISAGEHDMTDNILHLVLARLPDAPPGTKGISLFLVPKYRLNIDGSLGKRNGVSCGSIEHKMGINGNATCLLNFDEAEAYLIGPPHQGLKCMFTFMNESRICCAIQATGSAERSFQGALHYSKERLQMRSPRRTRPDMPADPIVAHPDVRRMLLTQKSLTEGGRLLNYYCAQQMDLAERSSEQVARVQAEARLALLTPIAKGFLSEMASEVTNLGIQVYGGHGYIRESGMEQFVRDARITSIYEGTTGIQGLDLLGRKVLGSDKALLNSFLKEIRSFCAEHTAAGMAFCTEPLLEHVDQWQLLTAQLARSAESDHDAIGAAAYDYLLFAGYITLGYFWAKAAAVALQKLQNSSGDTAFYQAKLETARFYFARILPRTKGLATTLKASSSSLMAIDENAMAF